MKLQKYVGKFLLAELRKFEFLMPIKMHFSIFSVKFHVHSFALYRKMDPTALNMGTMYSIRIL
jgi:hypothetical protein